MKNFSLKKVQDLKPSEQLKAQAYISKYFIPLSNGCHAFYNDGKYDIVNHETILKTYFDRMPKTLKDYYFKQNIDVRTIEYEFGKPEHHDDKLNLCPKIKHSTQPYNNFSTDVKEKVDIMLSYVKEVLCTGDQSHYIYLLKWIANVIHGHKNDSILYLKARQGYGKSTLFEFIRKHVLGNSLCYLSSSEPLLSKNNAILAGKLLIYFEELETFTTAQWMGVSSRLKKMATSDSMTYEDKYVKPYESRNLNSYVILSNNDAIKDDDGRRYFILDVSSHREIVIGSKNEIENTEYWDTVYSCFNDEVGHAFYCYLMEEIDIKGFKPQRFPMTKNKIDSFAKRLESHENFIKHHYVLQKLGIKCTVQELFDEYVEYCKKEQKSSYKKIEFGSKLKELGIEYYKTAGNNKYKVSTEFLHALATTRHWIHEIDDYCEEQPTKDEQGSTQDDELIQKYTQSEKDLKQLKNENERLRLELEALKQANKEETIIRVIEDSDDEECELQKDNDNVKKNYKDLDTRYWKKYYENLDLNHVLEDILTKEQINEVNNSLEVKKQQRLENKQQVPKHSEKPAVKVVEDSDEESEAPPPKPTPPQKPTKVKSILSIIDDSDDEEEEGEEKNITVRIKDNKIMKALDTTNDCEFLD